MLYDCRTSQKAFSNEKFFISDDGVSLSQKKKNFFYICYLFVHMILKKFLSRIAFNFFENFK